ncbi:RNA-directed DNA polymerase, eukaryota, Reverse transcriptase zinc-binding domain protein [Artemisia annua]|uniref:RNA-directed DNA polymerase, eukaryota, Reverse transcriptase zinc-binding domain protein n=1 Tax=Artemisia annua TaxID=35608 RepID=A0A2U1LWQ2_ARTAN|nr:RNA-directed DNA polymerase, eukaryota, Reverse transcriptase zinc-binding domain protein [Artemisia annua]
MFPRLYALELDKDCSLTERLIRVGETFTWIWKWRRALRSGRKRGDFDQLMEVVRDVILSYVSDSWRWYLEKSGKLIVKSICTRIEKQNFLTSNNFTRWSKLVPKKVNILVWRAIREASNSSRQCHYYCDTQKITSWKRDGTAKWIKINKTRKKTEVSIYWKNMIVKE